MAKIPRVPIQDFKLAPTPNVASVLPIDTKELNNLGRILMNQGLSDAADQARKEGVEAQARSEDGVLVRRDSGFFGFFDKQFDEGAKFVYQKQIQNRIDNAIGEAKINNPLDPGGFEEEMAAAKDEIFAGVPGDVLPGVTLYWNNNTQRHLLSIKEDGVKRELRVQQDQIRLDVEEAMRVAEKAMEDTGDVPVELEARLTALRERALEIGMTPLEVDALEKTVEDNIFISKKVFEYRQLDFKGRRKFMDNLLSNKGPLKERSFTERLAIKQKIQSIDDIDKARYATQLSSLKQQLTQAQKVLERGHKVANESELFAAVSAAIQASGDKGLIKAFSDYNDAKIASNTTNEFRAANTQSAQEGINSLRDLERSKGLTPIQSKVLEMAEKDIDDKAEANRTGNWLDYIEDNNVKLPEEFFDMDRADQVNWLEHQYGEYRRNSDGSPVLIGKARVNYYKSNEIDEMIKSWESGSFKERAATVRQIAQDLGAVPLHRDRALQQIARKNTSLGLIGGLLADNNTEKLGLEILEGIEFLEGEGALFVNKPSDTKATIQGVVADAFQFNGSRTIESYTEAIFALHANELKAAGKKASAPISTSDAKKLFERIIGGETWSMPSGETSVPLRSGLSARDSKDLWNSIDDKTLELMGDGFLPVDNRTQDRTGNVVNAERIKEEGRLVPVGRGAFAIRMPAAPGSGDNGWIPLMNSQTGRMFIFDPQLLPDKVPETLGEDFTLEDVGS